MPPFAAGTQVKIPLQQHLGAPATLVVTSGDRVLRGQLIGTANGFVSANIHASTSGQVLLVDSHTSDATGRSIPHVVIEADGLDERQTLEAWTNWKDKDAKTLVGRIAEAGIVGMGGAGFPTHVKLSPPPDKKIDTLIINGAECEPYLTSDHRVMLEYPKEIIEGVEILQHILGVKTAYIAIEEDKQDVIDLFAGIGRAQASSPRRTDENGAAGALPQGTPAPYLASDIVIAVLKTMYPQGSEKQQIYAITGREVPCSGLPMDVGCLVENVGTVLAIRNAVVEGWASDERVVTVTGFAVAKPQNLMARVGTPFSVLVAQCSDGIPAVVGGRDAAPTKIIAGGPMMGFAQYTLDVVVTKTTSGILALRVEDSATYMSTSCISCGRCNDVCPMRLLPSEMAQMIEADDIEGAVNLNLMDCFECGACAYVCPARRPLVQHFRRAKATIALKRSLEKKS